jgi:hypothetical protein
MSSILDQLASAASQKKQDLNINLAQKIAEEGNTAAVTELIDGLKHKTKAIRHDCIKALYEIGEIDAGLISPHVNVFLNLLDEKDNRMQWGAMTALSSMAALVPAPLYKSLNKIIDTSNAGSVITKDHGVRILVRLSEQKAAYKEQTLPLLLEQLLQSPVNQAPSYAEQILPIMDEVHKNQFRKIVQTRIDDTEQESKRKRLEKVLRKI